MYIEVFSIYVLGNCRTESSDTFRATYDLCEFKCAEVLFYLIALFLPWRKTWLNLCIAMHLSINTIKIFKILANSFYYYYFKPFREEKEPNLSLAPLTSGKEFGQMFVFHQEEETMNLDNKNNQYHIQITYGRMVVIVCLSTPLPYIIAVWLQFKN